MYDIEKEMKYFNKGRDNFLKRLRDMTFYERLEINVKSEGVDIKRSFKNTALKWHPDSVSRQGPIFANYDRYHSFMSDVFQLYKDAYQTLINENARKKYNLSLMKPVPMISSINTMRNVNTLYKKPGTADRGQSSIRKF